MTVQVHGVDELFRGSKRLFDRIGEQAPDRFEQVAQDAADAVRARVPRRTGRLASTVIAGRDGQLAVVGYDGGAPYDGWIDFGGTRGRPFLPSGRYLYPVALSRADQLQRAGSDAAVDEIRRFRWPSPTT